MASGSPPTVLSIRQLLPELVPEAGIVHPTPQPILPPGFPPLPALPESRPMPAAESSASGEPRVAPPRLRDGCHHVEFYPVHPDLAAWPAAVGTLRWEQVDDHVVVASGDFYRQELAGAPHRNGDSSPGTPWLPTPETAAEIPCFPRDRYHGYFQIGSGSVLSPLAPLPYRSSPVSPAAKDTVAYAGSFHPLRSVLGNVWQPGIPVLFHLQSATNSLPNPSPDGVCDRAKFFLTDATGTPLGELHVRWISPYFRDAVVEIDTEPGLPAPVDNGKGETWATAMGRAGWRVRSETGRIRVPTPPSGRWTYGQLHEAMVRSRESTDPDTEWRYHVSVVRSFADTDAPLGIAFDHESMDLNGIPREGVALYAGARLPADAAYGPYAGRIISECPDLFFHIALHEVGHAMGLYHNHVGFGVMDQLDDLATHAASRPLNAETLEPRFSADDIFRLRHLPDIHVRPGGTDFETIGWVEDRNDAHDRVEGLLPPAIRPPTSEDLRLHLSVARSEVPVGAPLRVDFHLVNRSNQHVEIPARLGLSTPYVRGWITSPEGSDNEFRSLYKPIALPELSRVRPGMAIAGSLTLLRGHRGALAARPGHHTLWIEIAWSHRGRHFCARQRVGIDVTAPETAAEARTARRLLRTAETLGYLVLGDVASFRDGESAIDAALEVPRLRPHFAYIKARALATTPSRTVDWAHIQELLSSDHHNDYLNRRERDKSRQLTVEALRQCGRVTGAHPDPDPASAADSPPGSAIPPSDSPKPPA